MKRAIGVLMFIGIQFLFEKVNSQGLIQEFINSADFNYVQTFINNNYTNLSLDLTKSTEKRMNNDNSTPIVTLSYIDNTGSIKVAIEATKVTNSEIKTPNNSTYLIMARDFTQLDNKLRQGIIKLYDLSYDGYKFSESIISNGNITSNSTFDMPQTISQKYSSVISSNAEYTGKLSPGQAQCDYNHNGNISYGECYKCYNSACSGNPNCNVMCYLFGDVIGWVWSPAQIPYCQVSMGIACIYIAIAY